MRIKSMQLPMNKLGTKESELNYVLKPVKAGVISDKEEITISHRKYIKNK